MKPRESKCITRSYDFGIPTLLLRFLGACIFDNAKAYYGGLNETEMAELEAQGRYFSMTAWFYRFLYDVLPETKRADYQRLYQAWQARAMIEKQELRRLYRVFASHGLRFIPIRGVDLAYPSISGCSVASIRGLGYLVPSGRLQACACRTEGRRLECT